MATTTHLTNPHVTIATIDLGDQCTAATLRIGYDQLESTAFGDTGRRFVKGLADVEVTLTLFLSYGTSEVEATLESVVGDGDTTIVIKATNATEGAANPHYTITNAMLASFTPINGTVGELATVDVTFVGGTWARDITPPT
ncbi:MAG: hypothetical protein ACO3VO_08980 [Ilumatobacteraceae bacterium]